ncbi:MAG: hypothetical protein HY670_09170 [Chloroflexi bacterium]|nr:hypothetical protein [Chloroflexota bacterium]
MRYCGYAGCILYVDLTTGKITKEPLAAELVEKFIGGEGINTSLACDLIPKGTDPLSPSNCVIIGTGALIGTSAPSCAKTAATTKSPLTDGFSSSAGGHFGPALKFAGYDHLVITGRAEKPVYLSIFDDEVAICDAGHLWGRDVFATTDKLKEGPGKCWVACIGPAGENLVKFANVMLEKQATWSRAGGMGAVWGSKNLKAIAVRGTKRTSIARPERFEAAAESCRQMILSNPHREGWQRLASMVAWPTTVIKGGKLLSYNYGGLFPKEEADRLYGPEPYLREMGATTYACPSCTLGCKSRFKITAGEYAGLSIQSSNAVGVIESFGTRCFVGGFDKAVKCLEVANRYGLEMITFSAVMEYLVDIYERNIITREDCGGFTPRLGFEASIELMDRIVRREGIGSILADGLKKTVETLGKGLGEHACQIKGIEVAYDLRIPGTESAGQLTSPMGGHAMRAYSATMVPGRSLDSLKRYAERIGVPATAMARVFSVIEGYNKTGRLLKWVEDYNTLLMCLGICNRDHIQRGYDIKTIAELYAAATGIELTPGQLLEGAARAWDRQRLFNLREGFTRQDDMPPKKFTTELLKHYDGELPPFTEAMANELLDMYYEERGWDREGRPREASPESR